MRFLLDLLYLLAAPGVGIFLLWRRLSSRRRGAGAGLREKLLGPPPRVGAAPCLWLHAVSVGEARAALVLIGELLPALPGWDFALSTATPTGREVARQGLEGKGWPVALFFAPLDLSFCVGRALRALRPRALVLIELELWPNLLLGARRAGARVLVANGRLTERSARRYRRAGALARWLFALPDAWSAQNEDYAARLRGLGVDPARIEVLGNLKYDAPSRASDSGAAARRGLGWEGGAAVVVCGCTHPGEETALLALARELEAEFPGLRWVLAPRHVERAAEVLALAGASGVGAARRWSEVRDAVAGAAAGGADGARLLVVDVMGALELFYSLADLVFVGGTLVPRGGHNVLEPAGLGKAVVIGPSDFNFADMVAHFRAQRAIVQVEGAALPAAIRSLLRDPAERESLAARAAAAARLLRGATARHVEWLRRQLAADGGAPR